MPKLKLSSRILLYFLLVSLVPLIVTNYLLISYANNLLVNAASAKQQAVANYLSDNLSSYLNGNIQSLAYLSRIYLDEELAVSNIDRSATVLFQQYPDLQRLAVLDSSGKEQSVFDSNGKTAELADASQSDPFKAIFFLSGKEYISSVNYNSNNEPTITIALPVLNSDFKGSGYNADQPIESGIFTANENIKGAVVATYNIQNLWETVLSAKVGENGYAYVVDGLGNLVAHPDSSLLASGKKLIGVEAVKQFVDGNSATRQTVSETGELVISTPQVIPDSGWAVIVEEPVSSINSGVNSYLKLAVTVGLTAVVLCVMASVFFRKQLTKPIMKLSEGAKRFGKGQFDQKIDIKSRDELQDLADTFNSMGSNISDLIKQMESSNKVLGIEKSKMDNIISSVSDGIVAVDRQGVIVSINPPAALLINGKPDDFMKKPMAEVFFWTRDDRPLQLDLSDTGTRTYSDITLQSGNQITYLDIVVSVVDRQDSEVGAIVTIHDLTKSRELEFMKLDFVAIAAHELRTPLTVVRGYLDMLNETAIKQFSIYDIENLQKVIHSVNELRDLINKLLNIARIERGDMEIFIEKLNLQKLVKENVHQHQTVAMQNQINLTYESNTESPVYVPADPSSITEVMNNLVGNAIKFTDKNGDVTVRLSQKPDKVEVEVVDNGPGIPAGLRGKLFTKFYRAERSLISGTRGTGLGLFISKTIIELQKGEIGLKSDTGKGSVFYFALPVYDPEKDDKLISKDRRPGGIRGWFKKNTNN